VAVNVENRAVDADFLGGRIDPGAQFGDHLPIDFDAALLDQFFALPAASQPGGGEDLLKAISTNLGI
jgi:hypothetical protein